MKSGRSGLDGPRAHHMAKLSAKSSTGWVAAYESTNRSWCYW